MVQRGVTHGSVVVVVVVDGTAISTTTLVSDAKFSSPGVPVLAVSMVVIRHVVQAEIYGDAGHLEPAVLRATGEHRTSKTQTAA